MYMIVSCDNCNKDFKIKMKVEKLGGGIEKNYFKCPKCKERYDISTTNNKIRKMQKELNMLQMAYNKNPSPKAFKNIKSKREEFKKEMLKLNERMNV